MKVNRAKRKARKREEKGRSGDLMSKMACGENTEVEGEWRTWEIKRASLPYSSGQ